MFYYTFVGGLGCVNRSRVSNASRVSDSNVLIQAGSFCIGNIVHHCNLINTVNTMLFMDCGWSGPERGLGPVVILRCLS